MRNRLALLATFALLPACASVPKASPQDYLIRLNRGPVAADYVLQEGDRISITARKIQGA